jgi:PAS domain S-box-containing protein
MLDRLAGRPMLAWRWAIAAAMVLVLALGVLAAREYVLNARATAAVAHTNDVLRAIDGVLVRLIDAETGHRGYLITGDRAFLESYVAVEADVERTLAELRALVADNPAQALAVDALAQRVHEQVAEMAQVLALFDGGDAAAAAVRLRDSLGKRVMDDVRVMAADLRRVELGLLDVRVDRARLTRRGTLTYGASTIGVVALLGVVGVTVSRQLERRRLALASETIARLEAEAEARDRATSLRRSEDFNQSLLDNTGDCVAVLTLEGGVVLINRPGIRLMQLAADGAWRHEPWPALWGAHATAAESAVAAARSAGDGRFIADRVLPSGTTQWWDVRVSPIKDAEGQPVRLVAIARDISEQKQAETQRTALLDSERAARAEAERATRLKDDFVSTLSHELRSPLNAILGWIGVLTRDQRPETLSKAIEVIGRNSRRQSQMIDDLLDIGRIISGKLRLDVERVDLASAIEEAVASARPAADAKGVRLVQVLGSAAIVDGDPGRLQQVFWNLVSNAIKFTARGGCVQVTLRRIDSHVEVQVSDTGIGIRPEVLPHVFQRFRQGPAETSGRQDGLGLGLAITKNLVEMHGGSVAATSEGAGHGSTFTVRLPLAVSHGLDVDDSTPATTPQLAHILDGITVLVVDDEPDARDIVQRLLEDAGASVLTMATADDALDYLARGAAPDAIVSDIGMPAKDGYEFMHRVRRLEGPGRSVPAAALTALARLEDRKRALMAGYQSHLAKPVDPTELVAMVASLSGRTGRN